MRWLPPILVIAIYGLLNDVPATAPAQAMHHAAQAFLATLEPEQRERVQLPFAAQERFDWHYTPRRRAGISLHDLTPAQQKAALEWLRAGLSPDGYRKSETIRQLETVLRAIEGSRWRDPQLYTFAIFGVPGNREWGWRYEGHHISLHWTVAQGKVASSPQFLGANPADVKSGPLLGTRALAREEDLARAFMKSLDPEQRRTALVSATAPRDILSGTERQASIQAESGIAYSQLTAAQQELLTSLIHEYAAVQPQPQARERLEKLRRAGLDAIKFAWMGGLERGQGHYYRIQGPTFLIEYDNTQNGANHIHSVWRDFDGDFGLDLLADHYRRTSHPSTTELARLKIKTATGS